VLELITQNNANFLDESACQFIIANLQAKSPRIQWETAKVIGNCASLFSKDIDLITQHLFTNSQSGGTVVRWCSAYALGEILLLKTSNSEHLLLMLEALCNKEENNAVRKKYINAIKK
jgi:hypothetical protein